MAGGGGFIGSHLAKRLLEEGNYVICADWARNEYFKEEEVRHLRIAMQTRADSVRTLVLQRVPAPGPARPR